MKKMIIVPYSWLCTLAECPAGFFVIDDELCFKTQYPTTLNQVKGQIDAYCFNGSVFWGGTSDIKIRANIIVQPVVVQWEDD